MRLVLSMVLSASLALAAPVPKSAQARSVAGTSWFGDGVVADTRYTFNADGTLTYTYENKTYDKGSWKQDGSRIYWETNNKYCEFEGTIQGDVISGKAWNVKDFRKDLTFKRVDP